jgi:hypothetical protein
LGEFAMALSAAIAFGIRRSSARLLARPGRTAHTPFQSSDRPVHQPGDGLVTGDEIWPGIRLIAHASGILRK